MSRDFHLGAVVFIWLFSSLVHIVSGLSKKHWKFQRGCVAVCWPDLRPPTNSANLTISLNAPVVGFSSIWPHAWSSFTLSVSATISSNVPSYLTKVFPFRCFISPLSFRVCFDEVQWRYSSSPLLKRFVPSSRWHQVINPFPLRDVTARWHDYWQTSCQCNTSFTLSKVIWGKIDSWFEDVVWDSLNRRWEDFRVDQAGNHSVSRTHGRNTSVIILQNACSWE